MTTIQDLMKEMEFLNEENLRLNQVISSDLASQKNALENELANIQAEISNIVDGMLSGEIEFWQGEIEFLTQIINDFRNSRDDQIAAGVPPEAIQFELDRLNEDLAIPQQFFSEALPQLRADFYNDVSSGFEETIYEINEELNAVNLSISNLNRTIAENDGRISALSQSIASLQNTSNSNQSGSADESGMSAEVAALSPQERAELYAQVGDAMYAPGFSYSAHREANTDENGIFRPPSYSAPEPNEDSSQPSTDQTTLTESSTNRMSAAVRALTDEQRADLFAQVGDLIYNPDWNLAAHIAGNMENGIFVAPSFEAGKEQPNLNATLDWGQLASELDLDLTPWENIDNTSKQLLGDNIHYVSDKVSDEVLALNDDQKHDLFKQVGNAMFAPGFNLAAHIAANTINGVFVPPTANAEADTLDNGLDPIDWLKIAEEQALDISNFDYNFVPVDSWELPSKIALPAEDSEAWRALMEETGGAAAVEGFDYLAHIAATTSQTILTELSETQVREIIIETGVTNFTDFDYESYVIEKTQATELSSKVLKAQGTALTSEDVIVGSKYNDRLDFSKSKIEKKLIATGEGDDIIKATKGNNIIVAGAGNDDIDGGDGLDSVVVKSTRQETNITFDKLSKKWTVTSDSDGVDSLSNVERIVFDDQAVALDIDGNAGQAYRLYKAAFDRDPMQGDTTGLGFWINASDNGVGLVDISNDFITSSEFKSLYGEAPSNAEFLTALYNNVLDRSPDGDGYEWWLTQMESNPDLSWAQLLTDFSESNENYQNVESLVEKGIVYDIFVGG